MFCYMCGSALADGSKFCVYCGTKQEIAEAAPVVSAAPVVEEIPYEPAPVEEPVAEAAPAATSWFKTSLDLNESEPVAPASESWAEPVAPVTESWAEPAVAPVVESWAEPVAPVTESWAEPVAPVTESWAEPAVGSWPEYGAEPAYAVQEDNVYAAAAPAATMTYAPVGQLNTRRSLVKFILLSIVTLGIYGMVVMSKISTDINIIAHRYDGKRTMPYVAACFIFGPITLFIVPLVWITKLCGRIKGELARRGIEYKFGAGTYWLWGVLGSLIIVGPFIYTHKLMKSMNLLCADYNARG